MNDTIPDFVAILRTLNDHDVNFVVVGALSAVLQGAPIMTFDLDVVHQRSSENISRLLKALKVLDAHYRGHPDPSLRPDETHLQSVGHQLLLSKYGPLDLLGAIEDGLGYEDLLEDAVQTKIDDFSVPILGLARYVELKESSNREKDRARLPTLRQTLAEQRESEES